MDAVGLQAEHTYMDARTYARTYAQRQLTDRERESARSSANHLKASVVYFAMQLCSLGGAMV